MASMSCRKDVHLSALMAPLLALAACGSGVGESRSVSRDSAGIRIVENDAPAWKADYAWSIASNPAIRIGAADGPASQQLFRVRYPRRRSDGSIILLNAGNSEARIYDTNGDFIRLIGRAGSGPGEFRSPIRLWLGVDDTVFIADLDRLSVFDSAGSFIRSHAFGLAFPEARLNDGSYFRTAYAPGVDGAQLGQSRPDYVLVRMASDGTIADTITRIAGAEFYRRSPDGQQIFNYRAPLGAERLLVPHNDRIYTGDGKTWEVHVLASSGELERILRRSGDARPVSAEAIRAFEAQMLESMRTDEQRVALQQLFREWTYPEMQPVYDRLLVDGADNVWLRNFQLPAVDSSQWTLFDAAGIWLGEVTLPSALAVEEIGDDYVLGVRTDELGVESVELYTLVK